MNKENRYQIPKSEGPESQKGKMINEQNATEGLRKNISRYSMF